MISRTLIKLSVVYFLVAIVLGNYMGIQQDFRLKHVHVHIAVLGWLSLALIGVLYRVYPELEEGWLPRAHLWLHNVGLVVFMGGFTGYVLHGERFVAPLGTGAMVTSLGILLFALNVLLRMRPSSKPVANGTPPHLHSFQPTAPH
jgi:cbb3-type cytochrome oxidase subunit 1